MTLSDDEDINILAYAAAKHMKPFEREAWERHKAWIEFVYQFVGEAALAELRRNFNGQPSS